MGQNNIPNKEVHAGPNNIIIHKLKKECYTAGSGNHSKILNDEYTNIGNFCSKTFDELSCWDETPAGTTAVQYCPDFVAGFDPSRFTFKKCMEDGTWETHPQKNSSWTNYTTCMIVEDPSVRESINRIYVAGYILSLISLLLSLGIFLYLRILRCTKIRIRMNLFTALVIKNILWIFWYFYVVEKIALVENNAVWCQVLHVVYQYFMVSGYMWMFCKCLHLHMSLVIVFVKEDVAIVWFQFISWGVPFIIVMIYATVRYTTTGANEKCWMGKSDTYILIIGAIITSVVSSLGVLINVIRVLTTTSRPTSNQDPSLDAKIAARAALIMIPLLGVHILMIPMHSTPGIPGKQLYEVISTIITSMQGLIVSVLLCFINDEVQKSIRNLFARSFRGNEMIALTGFTPGGSVPTIQEHII